MQIPQLAETAPAQGRQPALVTVVVPTCGRPPLLKKALASVLAQTHTNLEIVVVDDAASEATRAVVAGFEDARIRYLTHEKRKGGSAARNTGIRAARGEFIAFLDDDDEWEPEKTAAQLTFLRDSAFDAVLCMYSMEGRAANSPISDPRVTLDELRRGFVRGGSASTLMGRAEVFQELLFDEALPKCQDWDLCIRAAARYRLGCLNQPLVRYNDGAHDRISNRLLRLPAEEQVRQFRMLDKHVEFFGPWYRRHLCRFLLYGISRRTDKARHLLYVIRRVGMLEVLRVFGAWSVVRATRRLAG